MNEASNYSVQPYYLIPSSLLKGSIPSLHIQYTGSSIVHHCVLYDSKTHPFWYGCQSERQTLLLLGTSTSSQQQPKKQINTPHVLWLTASRGKQRGGDRNREGEREWHVLSQSLRGWECTVEGDVYSSWWRKDFDFENRETVFTYCINCAELQRLVDLINYFNQLATFMKIK